MIEFLYDYDSAILINKKNFALKKTKRENFLIDNIRAICQIFKQSSRLA